MNAATVGILVWIGLIAVFLVAWLRMMAGFPPDREPDRFGESSNDRVRREVRRIDGRCRGKHRSFDTSCPIVHTSDEMWEVWRDDLDR